MTATLDAALAAFDNGLCTIRTATNGSKRPLNQWKEYQKERPTREQVARWFSAGHPGFGVVCGAVSGGLEMLEFEGRAVAEGTLDTFSEAADSAGLTELFDRIRGGYCERTPSGGIHLLYRCPAGIGGNLRLARRPATAEELEAKPDDKVKVLIETRGEGGYTIVAPSNGSTHPTGKAWELLHGGFASIATVTTEEREALLDLARTFDRCSASAGPPAAPQLSADQSADSRPGDEFDSTCADVLTAAGFVVHSEDSSGQHYTRPGKSTREGSSATVWKESRAGGDRCTLFSTSIDAPAEYLGDHRALTAWEAQVALHYGGDHSAAASAWRSSNPWSSDLSWTPQAAPAGAPIDAGGEDRWPVLGPAALYGLAGEVVATLDPHTEADKAAVLISFLAAFGCAVGARPHAIADGSEHQGRLFAVLVGKTSRGRKGTAWANVRRLMEVADPVFTAERILGGLASGEGLIAALSDGSPDKDGNLVGAVRDKRLLILEPEFSRVLKVCARESSTLSAILRDAWDRGDLRVMTRKDPLRATGAHVSLLAHVTADELRRSLLESDAANGYGNRHLFIAAKRSKLLPEGGNLDDATVNALGKKIRRALGAARRIGIVRRSPSAAALWEEIYLAIDDDAHGMVGALTARAEAQLLRLSVVYALLDGSPTIEKAHIEAAKAVWDYSEATLQWVFGDTLGDDVADRLLAAIRNAGHDGLDLQAQSAVFGRNLAAARLNLSRQALERKGLVVTTTEDTGGRPRTVTRPASRTKETKETKEEREG